MNINVIPEACKGCGICAQVCPMDALRMVAKSDAGEADFLPEELKELDNTYEAARYVDQMPLMNQVLFVFSKLYPGRHTLCPGCSEGTISLLTFFAAESLRNHPQGIETFYQGSRSCPRETGRPSSTCSTTGSTSTPSTRPVQPGVGAGQSLQFADVPVRPLRLRDGVGRGSGAKFSLDQAYVNGFKDVQTKIVVFAGDGAIYDIGNGPFNYALGEDYDITWVIYNNEGYMNTGAQKSGATRFGSDRSTSPIGTQTAGKSTLHRRIISQAMAISHVYAAKLTSTIRTTPSRS